MTFVPASPLLHGASGSADELVLVGLAFAVVVGLFYLFRDKGERSEGEEEDQAG